MKRTFWVIIWIFAEILSVSIGVSAYAGPAADSSLIPSEFDLRYGVGKAGCSSNCHGLTRDSKFKDGTAYGLALQGAMDFQPNDTSLTDSQLLGFDNVEAEFAPHVSSIEGLTEPGGSITLSGATDTISVSFDVGKNFFGSQAGVSLSSLGLGGDLGSYVSNVTASSVEFSILEISKRDRGDRRRISSPYTLNFDPINSQGFKNFAAENQKRNRFDIIFSNIAPVGEPDNVIPSAENTATNKLNIDVLANDRDDDGPQDQLKVALISGLTGSNTGTLEIDSSGNGFLYSVPEQLPTNSTTETQFTYAPVDGENLQGDPVTVTIQIPKGLNPPVAEDDMFTLDEDTTLSENVFGNDSDPEGLNTVSFSIVNVPDKGALSFNSDGTFSYTPEENQTASVFFDYSASDGNASDQARVELTITAQNDAPVAIGDSFVSSSSNTSSNKLSLPVLGNDSDVDHDRSGLSVILVSDLTGTSPGMLELNSDSTGFFYTVPNPLPDSQQQTTFAYAPVDGAGAKGNTVSVSITIPSPSATPPVARDDKFTFAEDTILSENVSVDNGNGADSDPDGLGTVTYSILSDPLRGVLDLQSDGAFTYTPAENDEGDLSFQYNMDDGTTSVSGTVTLIITPVNDAPVGSEDTYDAQVENTDENKLEMRVLANDMDADHSSEDLSVVIVSDLADASEGSLEIGPDGDAILYAVPDPLPDTPTLVSFTYAPRDAEGLEGDPVTGTVSIPAKPVVSSVVAQNDAFSFEEDDVFSGDVKVDNGSGPDTSASGLDMLEFSVLNAPKEETGQLEMASNGTFTFTPTLDYTGSAQFDYVASDGTSSNTAKVVLTITPVNDAPVANATVLPRREESEADFTVDLLDPAYVADADGDTLKVDSVVVLVSFLETDNVPLKFTETDLYSDPGRLITFKPTAASDLDEDESATITLTYQILDGISEPVENTITQQIFGIDNGLGRLAGEYATSISERYNGHFGGINEANGSCHTCHVPGQVNADVDTVDECVQSPSVFNEYGLKLCLNRDAGTPALADLLRRMQEAEPEFAPRLSPSSGLLIDETATSGIRLANH